MSIEYKRAKLYRQPPPLFLNQLGVIYEHLIDSRDRTFTENYIAPCKDFRLLTNKLI